MNSVTSNLPTQQPSRPGSKRDSRARCGGAKRGDSSGPIQNACLLVLHDISTHVLKINNSSDWQELQASPWWSRSNQALPCDMHCNKIASHICSQVCFHALHRWQVFKEHIARTAPLLFSVILLLAHLVGWNIAANPFSHAWADSATFATACWAIALSGLARDRLLLKLALAALGAASLHVLLPGIPWGAIEASVLSGLTNCCGLGR